MPKVRLFSAAEQVAAHLRERLDDGTWTGVMPGVIRLEAELGVNRKTVDSALQLLEIEGLIVGQGAGRRRLIVRPGERRSQRSLRVALLLGEGSRDQRVDYIVELQHALIEAGHAAFFATKSAHELGNSPVRLREFVEKTAADAWVIGAATRAVLEWFSERPEPAFAMFGRREGLAMAAVGPDKPAAYAAATRRLIDVGHQRIVLLCREMRRLPEPGLSERAFLDELASGGLPVGEFNLPHWKDTEDGFHQILDALFQRTPPTALMIDEAFLFAAAQQFLSRRGLRVPEDVSLVGTDADPSFDWCRPSVAHMAWDPRPVVRRIVRWVADVGRGKKDLRQTLTKAEFVDGGTIGPPSRLGIK